ncbi:MAG: zf-HC2 domain-containing protein [Lachnospiraceae bacterium]|nr:zf-HC2 domain-containing protein [Lachnospiraceae bacterium]
MDCLEAEKLIKPFIGDELDHKTMEEFLNHIDNCSSCKEELSIQFLVAEGLARLEDGKTFDFNRALNQKIGDARKKIRIRKRLLWVMYIVEIAAIVTIIGLVFEVFIL